MRAGSYLPMKFGMNRRVFLAAAGCAPVLSGAKKSKAKEPEIEVVEASVKAEDGRLLVDGRLRNVSGRTVDGLKVIYEVLDADNKVLTRQTGTIPGAVLDAGEEAEFHVQMAAHARGISMRFEFEDGGGRELRAGGAGPFPIE